MAHTVNWWKISFCLAPYLVFVLEWLLMTLAAKPDSRTRCLLSVFGFLSASKFVGFQYLGGNAFNPELPVWLLTVWGWMESVVWFALPVGLCVTAAVLTLKLLDCVFARRFRRYGGFALLVTVALSAVLAAYGMWEGLRVPPVVEHEVQVEDLPPEFDGYRIAHLSDLHCSAAARREKIAGIVSRVNGCGADLVAITGDFVDGFPPERERDLEPLRDLRARDGVVASTGNHEKYWQIGIWEPYFAKWNVKMLRNRWIEIRRNGASLVVGGLDDPVLKPLGLSAFDGAPEQGFRILLYHRPVKCADFGENFGVRLQLSGHTHGGAMPLLAAFVGRHNEGHVRGLYRIGRLMLHVSPGSGQWAGFPIRLLDSTEISVLVLRGQR